MIRKKLKRFLEIVAKLISESLDYYFQIEREYEFCRKYYDWGNKKWHYGNALNFGQVFAPIAILNYMFGVMASINV